MPPKKRKSPVFWPVLIVTSLVKVTAELNEISEFMLEMLPPIELEPAPSCVNLFVTFRFDPTAVVNEPVLVTIILSPITFHPEPFIIRLLPVKLKVFPVVTRPFIVRLLPVKLNAPSRFTRPSKVVVASPADCVKLAAENVLEANTVPALVTVTAPRGFNAPTAPTKSMLPTPAVRPRVLVPLSVLPKEILPPFALEFIKMPLVNVTPPVKIIFPPGPVVVMFPPSELKPLRK